MIDDAKPIRVHVLVDLSRRASSGGHVKSWERLAEAAAGLTDTVELTVHFSGEAVDARPLTDNVRFVTHRSIFSSARLPFLAGVPDHADLAPYHPELARSLAGADVLHTTDAYFVFARTAERVARGRRIPLVTSIHTDTPRYASVFTAATLSRLLGGGRLARLVNERLAFPRRAEARMRRRLAAHERRCAAVVVSRPDQIEALERELRSGRVSFLRRGVDRAVFHPGAAERPWLERTFDVPADRIVVLTVGRLDRGKNVMTAVDAVAALAAEGLPVHLLCVGEGPDRQEILSRLGMRASCPGTLAPAELARVYRAADVVAHPSMIEESSNVVLEALTCGRPLLVAAESGSGRNIEDGVTGLVVEGGGVEPWARALRRVASDGAVRAQLGAAAAAWAVGGVPSWRDVLVEDLVPVWRRVREDGLGARAPRARGH